MPKDKTINPQKSDRVSKLSDLIQKAKSIAVVDYKGLTVAQSTELRRSIKKAGGEVKIEKNTLFKIALSSTFHSPLSTFQLEGPSAFVFSETDEVSAIKAVADFAKKSGVLTFKSGVLGDRVLSSAEIEALSRIPGRETLIAKLLGSLNSPTHRLVYALNGNISKLVRVLDAIRQSEAS